MLERTGLVERIGNNHFFPTVRTGVQAFIDRKNMPVEEEQPENAIRTGQVDEDEPKDQHTVLD